MDYSTFKEIVTEKILDYMPEKFKNYTVETGPVQKTNRKMDALRIVPCWIEEGMAVPVVYLEHMYKHYKGTGSISTVLENTAQVLARGFEEAEKIGGISFTEPEKRVTMSLVNTGQNREMLQHVPNRQFHDLSVVYRYIVGTGRESSDISSVLVDNKTADMMGMDEGQLFKTAQGNTLEFMGLVIKPLAEVLKEILLSEGMAADEAEGVVQLPEGKPQIYVITNRAGVNGAVYMMYDGVLQGLAQETGSDLYLLPSSVHEVMAVPAYGNPASLAQMVEEINVKAVELEERLSNNVYHYDKMLHKLSVAAGKICLAAQH